MQSIIIKEIHNSKNLVSITFDNLQVPYGIFSYTLVYKQRYINKKICNFGFYSNKKLENDVVKKILGNINEVQIKINCKFEERIIEYIKIKG